MHDDSNKIHIKDKMNAYLYSRDLFVQIFEWIEKERRTFCRNNKIKAKKKDLQWIIVVSSQWKEQSIQKFKHWINESGIIKMSYQVEIVPEIAAACINVQNLIISRSTSDESKENEDEALCKINSINMHEHEGTKYVLIDAGGSFTKISVHRIAANNTATCMYYTIGPWGGDSLILKFRQLLCNAFGKELIEDFESKHHVACLQFWRDFNAAKKSFDPEATHFAVKLPTQLTIFIQNWTPPSITMNLSFCFNSILFLSLSLNSS